MLEAPEGWGPIGLHMSPLTVVRVITVSIVLSQWPGCMSEHVLKVLMLLAEEGHGFEILAVG